MKHNFVHGYSLNKKIGSRLIRWGTKRAWQWEGDVPSHYFILFFRRIVVEARLESGVHITYWRDFLKKNKVIRLYVPIGERESIEKRTALFDRLLDTVYGKCYDTPALIYFAWRVILYKFFNKPYPSTNKWHSPDRYFCDELYTEISGKDMSMVSPNDLMIDMESRPEEFQAIREEDVVI